MSDGELKSKQVKCRKGHACDWCGGHIDEGELAQYRTGIHLGDFYSGHQHPECHQAMLVGDLDTDGGYFKYDQKRGKTYDESHA